MQVLSKWNQKVALPQKAPEMEYRKNEFIYSWLKGIAVQNADNLHSSLDKLYLWHSSNSEQEVACHIRNENTNKSRLEDWEIRNAYKSNMPL